VKKVVGLVSLLVLVGSAGAAELTSGSAPSFTAPRDYDTAKAGQSVAIGDLNGDGKLDVVSAHGTDFPVDLRKLRAVSVLLNRGGGRLGPSHTYPTGKDGDEQGAWSVAIGDLTGDGKADLATANPGGRSVSVLANRGGGVFDAPVNYPIDREPWDVAIADLDGDGRPDIATANPNTVSVLLSRGDGTFGDKVDYPTGRDTGAFVVGDLNADGKPDLATANYTPSTVSVHINRGDGSFEPKVVYRTGPGPIGIAIGDLDGDRKLDLVTANGSSGRDVVWLDSVSVLRNKGDGSFRPKRDYRVSVDDVSAPLQFNSVAIRDLNGDRRPDIVTADGHRWTISVLLNKGGGRLGARWDYGRLTEDDAGLGAEVVALGDLSGDRRLDVVTAKWDYVSVFVNKPGLCTVQDVEFIQLAAAKRKLARAHCRVGKIRHTYGVSTTRGLVFSQSPAAGTVLPKGGKVNLVVSRGPKR
jgi:hypothetical protein